MRQAAHVPVRMLWVASNTVNIGDAACISPSPADSRWLFLSSANLTEYAFNVNMELGILITGGRLPGHVEAHFDQMISQGC